MPFLGLGQETPPLRFGGLYVKLLDQESQHLLEGDPGRRKVLLIELHVVAQFRAHMKMALRPLVRMPVPSKHVISGVFRLAHVVDVFLG